MEPDPTRIRTPSDAARGTRGEDSAFPDGTLADPQVSPIPLASDPPTPGSEVEAHDPLAPTLESDVPLRPDEVDTIDQRADAGGMRTSESVAVGGLGGAVAGGAIGAVLAGPIGAVAGGVVGAALGGMAGGASPTEATEPRRAPGDLEEDDAFSAGEPVRSGPAGDPADAELRALDDPDDPHLPQDREVRP